MNLKHKLAYIALGGIIAVCGMLSTTLFSTKTNALTKGKTSHHERNYPMKLNLQLFLCLMMFWVFVGCGGSIKDQASGTADLRYAVRKISDEQTKWDAIITKHETEGYSKLLSVKDSQAWIKQYLSHSSIPPARMAVDTMGNFRVFLKNSETPGQISNPPFRPEGNPWKEYMTVSESEQWLKKNHYQVQKQADGAYLISAKYRDSNRNLIDINYRIGVGSVTSVFTATMTIDEEGNLRVKKQ